MFCALDCDCFHYVERTVTQVKRGEFRHLISFQTHSIFVRFSISISVTFVLMFCTANGCFLLWFRILIVRNTIFHMKHASRIIRFIRKSKQNYRSDCSVRKRQYAFAHALHFVPSLADGGEIFIIHVKCKVTRIQWFSNCRIT